MFDVAPSELLLVAFVALVVIGPKDLPRAMRFIGQWAGKARGVARQFRTGFDAMVREAELAEMEKKWAEENARIMREHAAPAPSLPAPAAHAGSADNAGTDTVVPAPPAESPAIPPDDAAQTHPGAGARSSEDGAPALVAQPRLRDEQGADTTPGATDPNGPTAP